MSFVLLSKKEAHLQALFSDDFILDFHDPKIHARNKLHETFLHYFTNFSAIFGLFFKEEHAAKWPQFGQNEENPLYADCKAAFEIHTTRLLKIQSITIIYLVNIRIYHDSSFFDVWAINTIESQSALCSK